VALAAATRLQPPPGKLTFHPGAIGPEHHGIAPPPLPEELALESELLEVAQSLVVNVVSAPYPVPTLFVAYAA
jgi:hypothetical protein